MNMFSVRKSIFCVFLVACALVLVSIPSSYGFDIQEQASVDTETLKLVQQGWRRAVANSRDVKQLQSTIRRTNSRWGNRESAEVHSFALKGNKLLYASSHNGHSNDPAVKISVLRLFDGTNHGIAKSTDLFQSTASDQEKWSMESLDQTGRVNPLISKMLTFVRTAGVKIVDSVDLDYFDLSSPHIVILELRKVPDSDGMVELRLQIDRDKYKGDHVVGIKEARMILEKKFDYLPVEVSTVWTGGQVITDRIEYQPFGGSHYVKKVRGTAESGKFEADRVTASYEMDIQLFSTEPPSDQVFHLATYGLTEPKPRTPVESGFRAWYLILAGVMIIIVGLIYHRLKSKA